VTGWIRLRDGVVPIGNRHLPSAGVAHSVVLMCNTGPALGSLEVSGVDELAKDAADLSVADVDSGSNIGARELVTERPGFLDNVCCGVGPRFDDLATPDDGEVRSQGGRTSDHGRAAVLATGEPKYCLHGLVGGHVLEVRVRDVAIIIKVGSASDGPVGVDFLSSERGELLDGVVAEVLTPKNRREAVVA